MVRYDDMRYEDIFDLAANMRADDIAEVEALGNTPEAALKHAYAHSKFAYVARKDGLVLGAFGVGDSSILGNVGCAWMLTTEAAEMYAARRELVKTAPAVVLSFLEHYDILLNYVDARYERALRWLRFLGFTIEAPVKAHTGFEFCRVSMEK